MTSESVKNNAHFGIRTSDPLGFFLFLFPVYRARHSTVCCIYVNLMCITLYLWNVMLNAKVTQLKTRHLDHIRQHRHTSWLKHTMLDDFTVGCSYIFPAQS